MSTKPRITLANIEQATEQEIYDQVAEHLLTQGAKSADEKGHCMYRDDAGRACAAGCLMSADDYKAQFENKEAGSLGVFGRHVDSIQELQDIHDNSHPSEWARELVNFAAARNLTPHPMALKEAGK